MTKKNTYTSSELPDALLEELEEVRAVFMLLIGELTKKHSHLAINAGLSKAHVDFLWLAGGKNFKEILLNVADYYLKEAEKIKEEV